MTDEMIAVSTPSLQYCMFPKRPKSSIFTHEFNLTWSIFGIQVVLSKAEGFCFALRWWLKFVGSSYQCCTKSSEKPVKRRRCRFQNAQMHNHCHPARSVDLIWDLLHFVSYCVQGRLQRKGERGQREEGKLHTLCHCGLWHVQLHL